MSKIDKEIMVHFCRDAIMFVYGLCVMIAVIAILGLIYGVF